MKRSCSWKKTKRPWAGGEGRHYSALTATATAWASGCEA